MSPLLPPPDPDRHECPLPLVQRTYKIPADDDGDAVVVWSNRTPPDAGSTWDCPECGRVWVSRLVEGRGQRRYGEGYSPSFLEWQRASLWRAHQHRSRTRTSAPKDRRP
ncbi:hypothetical protein N866_07115 [Actinotalea ferrariae CF5-4]|uniref:Uncharacterized protein n=1 Tax=Actinotalea ferrariae CF5-4 TaxID=948458 RepID=A0A021VXC0_9CELL|nr:hypothetical protein [Actinotalea ferrariae]EYR64670.1 hypothetical protein N866_07115 [Actinotalea ferrariae CF5-4]